MINATSIDAFNRTNATRCVFLSNLVHVATVRNGNTQDLFNYLRGKACIQKSGVPLIIDPEIMHKKTIIHH